jgi:hypothetical protein
MAWPRLRVAIKHASPEARRFVGKVLQAVSEYEESVGSPGNDLAYYYLGLVMATLAGDSEGEEHFPDHVIEWLEEHRPPVYLDHIRYDPKRNQLIAHPYDMGLDELERLVCWVKIHKLELWIDGYSGYFPGHTFRIRIPLPERR